VQVLSKKRDNHNLGDPKKTGLPKRGRWGPRFLTLTPGSRLKRSLCSGKGPLKAGGTKKWTRLSGRYAKNTQGVIVGDEVGGPKLATESVSSFLKETRTVAVGRDIRQLCERIGTS